MRATCSIFNALRSHGRYTLAMKMIRTLLASALAGLCFAASAQWQWIDKDGHKVFSDRAPPADIQDKNILKRPGNRQLSVTVTPDTASETDAPAAAAALLPASAAKTSGLDKELEAKKKQAADAETAKHKAADAEVTKAKVENCARAKQAKVAFDSGARLGRTNAVGEREFMDEPARATEIKRINAILARDCN